jgi:hypothetical protein
MHLRRYIVAGLLVWVPLGVTLFVLNLFVGIMDQTLLLLPEDYRPENILGFNIPGLGIVLTIVVLMITGILVANLVAGCQPGWPKPGQFFRRPAESNSAGPYRVLGCQEFCRSAVH